jgi:uncharacterized secreted protein with C-terminal beta-propeller domain
LNLITLDTSSDSGKPVDWDLALAGSQLLVTDGAIYTASHGGSNYNQTVVEKFDFGPNGIQWTASGTIDGTLLNSFSMDDHNGQLRVATTNASFIRREIPSPIGNIVLDLPPTGSSSNLYVLEEAAGGQLSVIGSITGLAPGEQIYAARFVQDLAYLVTFERVDPLFVINLADPTKPTVEGELKIPGFSQYMEMIGDDHILSVGRDADPATGMFGGIVVSLFDVRDASSPKLKSRVEVEGSRNLNLPMAFSNGGISDHHAVRYLASHETLALPIWGYFENGGGLGQFYKMLTFKVDVDKGIVQSGAIKFDSMVTRAVRLGDFLYSMSGSEITGSTIDSRCSRKRRSSTGGIDTVIGGIMELE